MTFLSVPLDTGGQVPIIGAHLMIDNNGGYFILEHPAGNGLPEVNPAVRYEGIQNIPVFIPDQVMGGEYGGEYGAEYGAEYGGEYGNAFDLDGFDDDVQHIMDLFVWEDDTENSGVWSDRSDVSSDSGNEFMSEPEEDKNDEGEDPRPGSLLDQEFLLDHFWEDWSQVDPSVFVSPVVPAPRPAGPSVPADPPVSSGPVGEEPAPSTSGLGSSTKRSREESPEMEQSAKRQRKDSRDMDDEQPSTSSGLRSFPVRGYWPARYNDSDSD